MRYRRSDGASVAFKRFPLGYREGAIQEVRALQIAKEAEIPFVVDLLGSFRSHDMNDFFETELVLAMPLLEALPLDEKIELDQIATIMRGVQR